MDRFLRRKEVEEITSLTDPTMWREEREGRFPQRRNLTKRIVAWLESEVLEWMETRVNHAESATGYTEEDRSSCQ